MLTGKKTDHPLPLLPRLFDASYDNHRPSRTANSHIFSDHTDELSRWDGMQSTRRDVTGQVGEEEPDYADQYRP